MQDFEKLGAFYLGRRYDLRKHQPQPEIILYDSRDLLTHAVCLGMTGSGKTGLCIGLLEEAAIDGIPVIAIDPKGDLSNILLTFPGLGAEDFMPWVSKEEASRNGLEVADYASQQAELWKKGLAEWGQNGDRIRRLRESAEFQCYTPGSNAGLPVSVLKSFSAPSPAVLEDDESLRDAISGTVTSLLGLLEIEADPIHSREHILLSTIIGAAWKQEQNLDLAGLIQQIQTPTVSKVGVLDLESFYPSKDRFGLAMQLNNLLASPGFDAWLEGEPLDITSILHNGQGKPRVSVFSIAHLNDRERMFFVSLLLNQILSWVRTQSGTNSLRAVVYMDEIFGYFPPTANPPSKTPLLTLLKQARAFGVGIVLATQNPVDLDYKGLSNTGTWFIGRLQTERDKARVLDGLEGAAASGAATFDRQKLEQTIAGLGNRIFLMNNVHEDAPEIFETRWTMSYLRGPLTRAQIKMLVQQRGEVAGPSGDQPPAPTPESSKSAAVGGAMSAGAEQRPVLSTEIPQYFIPIRSVQPPGASLFYKAALFGTGKIYFADQKAAVDVEQEISYLTTISENPIAVDWAAARQIELTEADLVKDPEGEATYEALPAAAAKAKSYDGWRKSLQDVIFRTQKLELQRSPSLNQVSKPGEADRDFRIRLQQAAREERDRMVEALRQKYATKTASLQERIRRAQQTVERESAQAQQQKVQTAISFGTTLLSAFLGRKSVSLSSLSRATTAARGVSRTYKESQDIDRATENVDVLRNQLAELERQFQQDAQAFEAKMDPLTETLETIAVRPKKANINVRLLALAWTPHWLSSDGNVAVAWE